MYDYMKNHEAIINEKLDDDSTDLTWLSDYHLHAIYFVQHERLIHLMVTFFFALLLILSIIASYLAPQPPFFLLDIILFILLGFYIRHYYRLENGVQHWYNIYHDIEWKRLYAMSSKAVEEKEKLMYNK